jgi:CheY-like chemotaxis protein
MATGLVLVIEDHDDTRHMVEEYLTWEGVRVVAAENGLTGLAALQQHRPCVVLLDLTMPVMDGWQFRNEQQRLDDAALAGTPVIVLSALPDAAQHAETLRADAVIPKPIDFDRMIDVVRTYCGPRGA